MRRAEHVKFVVGGLYAFNFVRGGLEGAHGGDHHGAMAFVRFKVN